VGLKAGDRIVAINGNKPSDDPNDPVFKLPIGTVLHLDVRRGETSQAYNITLRDVI
jgi:C-terminal processing protease CtpA/Prc